jgi:hypothetical protein
MAASRINKPTPFAHWIQTKSLFDDGVTATVIHVTDGHEEGVRHAYGRSPEGWCFYIAMTHAEEPVFWQTYLAWVKRNPTGNHRIGLVARQPPPNCGTPNTPPCPDVVGGQGGLVTLRLNPDRGEQAA